MSSSTRLGLLMVASLAAVAITPFVGIESVTPEVLARPGASDPAAVIFWQLGAPSPMA